MGAGICLMPTLQNQNPTRLTTPSAQEQQQRRRMMIALLVLLLALILVLFKDRQMLFSPSSPESEAEPATSQETAQVIEQPPAVPVSPEISRPVRKKVRGLRQPITATVRPRAKAPAPSIVMVASRAVLPPLEVEVVAGNQRHPLDASARSVNVRMQDGLDPVPVAAPTQAAGTANGDGEEQVQLSPGTAKVVDSSVEPSYPLLAKQMKVQGAVILEAMISKAGTIQEIQVLSGPAILSAAAREAVRQWRFKPFFKGGEPVDSQARVTVNFTISTY